MITKEVITYIKKSLDAGKARVDIERELFLGGGWSASDLDEAFRAIEGKKISVVMTTPRPYKKVRLVWVIVLILIAGYIGWWIRDRQQFFSIQKIPSPQSVLNAMN